MNANHTPRPLVAIMRPDVREVDCEYCQGEGAYEALHPAYGTRSCPEPYVWHPCGECEGTGKVWREYEPVSLEDLEERDKQEIAASKL